MRHALTLALQQFEGAMLLVSHDRALIRDTTDELWLVADGRLKTYEDDLDTYTRWLARFRQQQQEEAKAANAGDRGAEPERVDAKTQRRLAAEQRLRLAPLKKTIDKLEKDLGKAQAELAEIETALADGDIYSQDNKDKLKALLARQAASKQLIDQLEERWLEGNEELEALSEADNA